jgi:hypothetical protein
MGGNIAFPYNNSFQLIENRIAPKLPDCDNMTYTFKTTMLAFSL